MLENEGVNKISVLGQVKLNLSTPPPGGLGLPSARAFRQAQGPEFNRGAQAEGLEVHPEPRPSTPPSKVGLRAAEWVKSWIFILLIPLLTSCATIKQLLYTYDPLNFHDVKEGVLYRSAQPSGRELFLAVREYNIRSVINLRGAHPGESWYDIEKAVSDKLGLQRVDIAMSAVRLPHREDLIRLLDAFRELPQPILVHCRAGADRTGEASAIFAMDHLKWSRRKVAGQLHPYYGHIPDFTPAKTYFIREIYQGEEWARNTYDPCKQDYKYYDKQQYCGIDVRARPYSIEEDDER